MSTPSEKARSPNRSSSGATAMPSSAVNSAGTFAAPVGGLLADRMDRRLIMVTCDLARAGLIVLVPFFGIGMLYVLAFVHECISLLFLPARDASVPLLVPDRPDVLPLANGLVLA